MFVNKLFLSTPIRFSKSDENWFWDSEIKWKSDCALERIKNWLFL